MKSPRDVWKRRPSLPQYLCPLFTHAFGRRRGWLLFSQLLLIVSILLLALTDPARSPFLVALGALLVATTSSTQDIVVDAFRVESLSESEQVVRRAAPPRRLLDGRPIPDRAICKRDFLNAIGIPVGIDEKLVLHREDFRGLVDGDEQIAAVPDEGDIIDRQPDQFDPVCAGVGDFNDGVIAVRRTVPA